MGRIYDALQRADLERRAAQKTEAAEIAEPFAAPGQEDLPPVKTGFALENIALQPWSPSMLSLPTTTSEKIQPSLMKLIQSLQLQYQLTHLL